MTIKELKQEIETFNKQPNEYTKDELFKIGLMFKQVKDVNKRWSELNDLVGGFVSGEAYRAFVKRKQDKQDMLLHNTKVLTNKSIADLNKNEINDEIDFKLQQLKKEEIRVKDQRNGLNNSIRQQARLEGFCDSLNQAIMNITPFQKITREQSETTEREAILLFSDLHIGALVDSFYNKYNKDIAFKRVCKLVDESKKYCEENKVKRLTILNLGDLIDGNIHITGRIEHNENIVDQCVIASEIVANMLNDLSTVAPEVIYRSCTDNHARITPDRKLSIEEENFNRLIDFYLQARLRDSNIKFVNDNISVDIGLFKTLNKKNVLFVHGHRDKNLQRSILGLTNVLNKKINYLMLGHFHSNSVKCIQGTTIVTNGSVMGVNDYANSIRLYGEAQQTLVIIDGDNLINYSIKL